MTTLAARYEIRRTIKRGGMGAVHEAWDLRLETKCAVKEMLCEVDDVAESLVRFEREARLLARLSHPGLPRVYDYMHDGTRAWLVMDFVEGRDLDTLLADEGRLDGEGVTAIALQVLDVLAYLHDQEPPVIYKDLKPSNIMLRPDGRVMLVDFGIATTVRVVDPRNTAIGTQGYAPREQFLGQAEPRSDLYALGATMHHLLSGQEPLVPFQFTPLRRLRDDVSLGLEAVVQRALALDAGDRFPSAQWMAKALRKQHVASPVAPRSGTGVASTWARSAASTTMLPAAGGAKSWSDWAQPDGPQTTPDRPGGLPRGVIPMVRTISRSGAEYRCERCARKAYSFSGLSLHCSQCMGPMVQLGSA